MTETAAIETAPDEGIVGDGLDSDELVARWLRRERDAGRLVFDASDRPVPGSSCWLCLKGTPCGPGPLRGEGENQHSHFCPAKGYLGDYAVCRECGLGEPCGHAAAIDRMRDGLGEAFAPAEDFAAAGPCRQVPIEEALALAEVPFPSQQAESAWKIKGELSEANLRMVRRRVEPGRVQAPPVLAGASRIRCSECLEGMRQRSQSGKCAACRVRKCGECGKKLRKSAAGELCRVCGRLKAAAAKRLEAGHERAREAMAARLSDEVRAAILAEPETMSYEQIRKKHGVSWIAVRDIRGPKKKKGRKAVKAAAPKAELARTVAAPRTGKVHRPGAAPTVMLTVPEHALDRMWAVLDLESKGRTIQRLLDEGAA